MRKYQDPEEVLSPEYVVAYRQVDAMLKTCTSDIYARVGGLRFVGYIAVLASAEEKATKLSNETRRAISGVAKGLEDNDLRAIYRADAEFSGALKQRATPPH